MSLILCMWAALILYKAGCKRSEISRCYVDKMKRISLLYRHPNIGTILAEFSLKSYLSVLNIGTITCCRVIAGRDFSMSNMAVKRKSLMLVIALLLAPVERRSKCSGQLIPGSKLRFSSACE